jgi:hypothetical protein
MLCLSTDAFTSDERTAFTEPPTLERGVAKPRSAVGIADQTDGTAKRFWDAGASGACEFTAFGISDGSRFSGSVATGDVNGDNILDLILGSEDVDDPTPLMRTGAGAVYVFFGGTHLIGDSALASTADVTIFGIDPFDGLGTSVACADVNDDGLDDIIAGTQDGDGFSNELASTGEVHIIFGDSALSGEIDLSTTTADVSIWGPSSGTNWANQAGAILAAGDVNGDQIDDVVVHAITADAPGGTPVDVGLTWVFYGDTSWSSDLFVDSDYDVRLIGVDVEDALYTVSTNTFRGSQTLAVGDVNCDGYGDICLVLPGAQGPGNTIDNSGELRVVFGSSAMATEYDLEFTSDVVLYNEDVNDVMIKVNTAFINGDTCLDIAVASRYADGPTNTRSSAGEVDVLFGSGSLSGQYQVGVNVDMRIHGSEANDRMNEAISGDIDGDGVEELILSSYLADGPNNTFNLSGEVLVFERPDTLPSSVDLAGIQVDSKIFTSSGEDALGIFEIHCADVTGDDTLDIIIAATFGYDADSVGVGKLHVIDGASFYEADSDTDAVVNNCDNCLDEYNPDQADSNGDGVGDVCSGCCVSVTGNVDGDGGELVDIGDLTALIQFLYIPPNPEPICLEEANCDGIGEVDIGDLTQLIQYLYIPPNPDPAVCP